MEAQQASECPVCGRSFDISKIEQHVNDCLNDIDDMQDNTETTSSSSWGCLQPGKRKSKNESREKHSPENVKTVKRLKTTNFSKNSRAESPITIQEDSNDVDGEQLNFEIVRAKITSNSKDTTSTSSSVSFFQNKTTEFIERKISSGTTPHTSNSFKNLQNTQTSVSSGQNPFFQKKSKESTSAKKQFSPLAEQMRPSTLDNYVGQDKAVGEKSLLHSLLRSDHVPSMILWGPPGCGKTTLARIIAVRCKENGSAKFVPLSATTSGVNDVKEVIKIAKNDQKILRRKTVLFLDEIHRFNKSQQDTLLPHVEDGTIILIGATTENPSFQVNSALLSRCRVIVLEKLSSEALILILKRALSEISAKIYNSIEDIKNLEDTESSDPDVWVDHQAIDVLANLCDGDARAALNSLQMAVQSRIAAFKSSSTCESNGHKTGSSHVVIVNKEHIKDGLQRSHVQYDKTGDEHYNIVSALHKSIRGSDSSAALYWLARMLQGGEDPLYIARRLIRAASEDIGLADPAALNQSVAAFQACHLLGMPECEVILAQCVVYLARAPKSVDMYDAYKKAKTCIQEHEGALPGVPLHLRNAPTKLMKSLGYGKGYKYNPAFKEPVKQDYFPEELLGTNFFT